MDSISDDWTEIQVSMRLRFFNRNFVGTHFGGSLYSMVDPFYMLMLLHHLKRTHVVWDQAAEIVFKHPGRGRVTAVFRLPMDEVARVVEEAKSGEAVRPVYTCEVVDSQGVVVAQVKKTLYVRKKE